MSQALLIAYGGRAPVDLAENRAFHQSLLDDLSAAYPDFGWAGANFCAYGRTDNYVRLEIVPGNEPLSLERLAAFREEQRWAKETSERQVG